MSRGYGLGAHYLTDDMMSWHRRTKANYTHMNGIKAGLPRYYKDKIWPVTDWSNYRYLRELFQALNKKSAMEAQEKIMKMMIKKHGKNAEAKLLAMRVAHMSQVKQKIAFTQKF